jgi:hypothetical protein
MVEMVKFVSVIATEMTPIHRKVKTLVAPNGAPFVIYFTLLIVYNQFIMGYQYGINICREALCILSTNQEFEERTSRGFSEMNVITGKDVSKNHFKEIKSQFAEYLSFKNLSVSRTGELESNDRITHLQKCVTSLVFLCVEIIEHNSRNSKKN